MKKNQLGRSDLWVSELSLGCMSLDVANSQSASILNEAVEQEINFFDTADLYDFGENEKFVGKTLSTVRDRVIIATKVGNDWKNEASGWKWNPTKAHILGAVEDSLKRLKTDYIDLYQLHGGTIEDPFDETLEAFELLKKQGKIRAYGISSIRPNVIRHWVKHSNLDTVMMQYSLLDRRPEEEILELLHKHSVSVLTRGTLAKGLLIDKPATDYLDYSKQEVQQLKEVILQSRHALSAAKQFVLQHKAVASVVAGASNKEQVQELVNAIKITVSKAELEVLSAVLAPNRYSAHR